MFDRLRRLRQRLYRRPETDSRINLALQGGGTHGAYTWGVLDRLLEYGIRIEGISGTSAGALNAAALASGWAHGGADGAREALHSLWSAINGKARLGPLQSTPLDYLLHGWNLDWSPGFMLLSNLTRVASPYQLNLGGYNPVAEIARELVDFEALARDDAIRLFIALTNVHSGKLELRRNHELNADVLAASACLPLVFQAVSIDGVSYWDCGYTGNPALFPLIFECKHPDVLLIQLTPETRPQVPTQVGDIVDRANEIAFHANLTRELQMIGLLQRYSSDWLGKRRFYLHQIDPQDAMANLGKASRINADWAFLCPLRDMGNAHADAWLEQHAHHLGQRSSVNLESYA